MKIDEAREYILNKKGTIEYFPFDKVTPVFKIGDKMFSLFSKHEKDRYSINLKYYKEKNEELREMYNEITPGYHMNKSHWNTVYIDGRLDDELVKKLIDVSYDIVFKSLTKIKQKEILER